MPKIERDLFGLPLVPDEDNPEFEGIFGAEGTPGAQPVEETPPEEGAPETSATPETPAPEAPQAAPGTTPEAPEVPEGQAEGQEEPESPEDYRWAGKYLSPQELEKGYRHLNDQWRRTSERARAAEDYAVEQESRVQQLESSLQRVLPYLQEISRRATPQAAPQAAPQPTRFYNEQGEPVVVPQPQTGQSGMTPQQIAALTEQIVAERLQTSQAAMQQQADQRAEYNEAEAAITGFYEAHPEVETNSDADRDIVSTMRALDEAWANRDGGTVDVSSPESLEIVYEASRRPALREVLALNPQFFDSDTGMDLARMQASVLEGQPVTQATRQVPASRVGSTVGQRKPVVERASTGSPQADADKPLDPFEEGVVAYRREQQGRGGESLFFE